MTFETRENQLPKKKNILLFVDNCSTDPNNVQDKLKNRKFAYFPFNINSFIESIKINYLN